MEWKNQIGDLKIEMRRSKYTFSEYNVKMKGIFIHCNRTRRPSRCCNIFVMIQVCMPTIKSEDEDEEVVDIYADIEEFLKLSKPHM